MPSPYPAEFRADVVRVARKREATLAQPVPSISVCCAGSARTAKAAPADASMVMLALTVWPYTVSTSRFKRRTFTEVGCSLTSKCMVAHPDDGLISRVTAGCRCPPSPARLERAV